MTTTTTDLSARDLGVSDPGWAAAFDAVPRHVFTERAGPVTPDREYAELRRVARMLDVLRVRDGHRLIVHGVGSGYVTALACHRLGVDHVYTVDTDPAALIRARICLAGAGYPALLVHGGPDGRIPMLGKANRLLSLGRVEPMPAAWTAHVHPAGVIVAPIGNGIVRATVTGDGCSARGRFLPDVVTDGPGGALLPAHVLPVHGVRTIPAGVLMPGGVRGPSAFYDIDEATARALCDPGDPDAWLWLALLLPGLIHDRDRGGETVIIEHPDGPWLQATGTSVHGGGPSRLWPEIITHYRRWERRGRITRAHIGYAAITGHGGDGGWPRFWHDPTPNPEYRTAADNGSTDNGSTDDDDGAGS